MTPDNAWEQFWTLIEEARARLGTQNWVPIALICVQADARADEQPDEQLDVYFERDSMILWPAEIPIAQRGPLLARLAQPYRDGTVLRVHHAKGKEDI